MIIKVDGWVARVPPEAEYIEFTSSHASHYAGTAQVFDRQGRELKKESLGLVPEPAHWTQRVSEGESA
jgi:hypothetical protein